MSFKSEREIKTFLDKQRMKEFVTTRQVVQEMPKGVLQVEMKEHLIETQTVGGNEDLSKGR